MMSRLAILCAACAAVSVADPAIFYSKNFPGSVPAYVSVELNKDGSVRVSLTGATPAPAVVREMTLLRAAELATENKKPAFEIVERDDYARYQTTSRDGFEISRVATGYKSDVVIRFVDAGSANPRALDARKIVDALGPFYYKDDKR